MNTDQDMNEDTPQTTRAGFVALIGAPNAGKSTLLNQLVGTKVAIVTHKVQTTRTRIRGIAMEGADQIVFVDTPGIFRPNPKRRLDRAMVDAAWAGAADADLVVLVVDAQRGRDEAHDELLAALPERTKKPVLALNKIDAIERARLLEIATDFNRDALFQETFMISALTGDGVADLRSYLAASMPPGPWLYPEDQAADLPMRLLAAEVTREKLYLRLHEELPYSCTIETESWQERKDDSVRIDQIVYVARDSQRSIVLGKGGQAIKGIGQASRTELEGMLERRVHLFLTVKVRENWMNERERYRNMGLDFPTD